MCYLAIAPTNRFYNFKLNIESSKKTAVTNGDLFVRYTVDSNVLQLLISGFTLSYCSKNKPMPDMITTPHFISAVGLTITFLIVAFVPVPEGETMIG